MGYLTTKQTNIVMWVLIAAILALFILTLANQGIAQDLLFEFQTQGKCVNSFCAW